MKQMILTLTRIETDESLWSQLSSRWGIKRISFEQQLSRKYASLSTKLKDAADFVVSNPVDVATRSLRKISKDANLSPATFSRMSTALGYESYEDLRDVLRNSIQRRANSFSERVENLQQRHDDGAHDFQSSHVQECTANLQRLGSEIDPVTMNSCVEQLHTARRVLVLGALGSTGIAEHMVYMANFIAANWSMASRMGASLASGLVGLSKEDVLIVVTKPPFATKSINAVLAAQDAGAFVIVITDTHTCPALPHASAHFIVPTDSQHFFSSYAATLVLSEVMIGMLAARAGQPARTRITEVESQNQRLGEVWGV